MSLPRERNKRYEIEIDFESEQITVHYIWKAKNNNILSNK
jgi:hypothetical protein